MQVVLGVPFPPTEYLGIRLVYNCTCIPLQPQKLCLEQSSDSTVTLYPATTSTEVIRAQP